MTSLENTKIITLDVRDDIRAGREPLSKIMGTIAGLQPDQSLRLLAPLEPAPLFELLGRRGFHHTARPLAAGEWETLFTRQPVTEPATIQAAAGPSRGNTTVAAKEVIELDARGLEPPQPLVKILESLGSLLAHAELRAHTDRRPVHLYAHLAERGFTGNSQEQSDGSFITHIRRS